MISYPVWRLVQEGEQADQAFRRLEEEYLQANESAKCEMFLALLRDYLCSRDVNAGLEAQVRSGLLAHGE